MNQSNVLSKDNRTLVLIMGVVGNLFLGVIYAWSIFVGPLEETFGWVRSQTSLVYSISMVCTTLGGFIAGQFTSRFSVRNIVRVCALMIFVGFTGCYFATGLTGMCLFYGIFVGLGIGGAYLMCGTNIIQQFPDKSGMVTGLTSMGYGFSSMIVGTIASYIIESGYGWRIAFLVIGIMELVIINLVALVLKDTRKAKAAADVLEEVTDEENLKPMQMIRQPSFWMFFVWQAGHTFLGICIVGQCSPIISECGTAAAGIATLAVGLINFGNGAGRLLNGVIFDKLGAKYTLLGIPVLATLISAGIAVSFTGGNVTVLAVMILFMGIVFGGVSCTMPMFVGRVFGLKYLQKNAGVFSLLLMPAFMGSSVAGAIRTATGSYALYLKITVVVAAFLLAEAVFLYKKVKQEL